MASSNAHESDRDRRQEPRFDATGVADIVVREPTRYARLTGAVVDVSRSGIQVEMEEPLHPGDNLELRLREVIVVGQVTNCRPWKGGRYRVGVHSFKVAPAPLKDRHLPESDLEPYLTRKGLTDAQRNIYTEHLAICTPCRQSLEEALTFLDKISVLRSKSRDLSHST